MLKLEDQCDNTRLLLKEINLNPGDRTMHGRDEVRLLVNQYEGWNPLHASSGQFFDCIQISRVYPGVEVTCKRDRKNKKGRQPTRTPPSIMKHVLVARGDHNSIKITAKKGRSR